MFRVKIWDHCRYVQEKTNPYPEMLRHLQACAKAGIDSSIIYLPEVISLNEYCRAAAEAEIKVEARIFPAWQNPNPALRTLPEEKWREMQKKHGIKLQGLCLNHPDNHASFLKAVENLCQEFSGQLSAISLDFIRNDNAILLLDYPCECPACRELRKRYFGKERLTASEAMEPALLYKELDLRCRMVEKLLEGVKRISSLHGLDLTIAARANYLNEPDIRVAPVWGLGPALVEGQDWVGWLERGLIDNVYPMNYHTDEAIFAKLLQDYQRLMSPNLNKLFSGIGLSSSMGELATEALEKHLTLVREQGFPGAVIFNKSNLYNQEQLQIVRKMTA